ncbi:MAG: rRNA maturation RNase YbeY [Bernardetiaceae bacterium]|nr:rRNA maturation RNase YbeY [Bernardetiaceae bacterium]
MDSSKISIFFFSEQIDFDIANPDAYRKWLNLLIQEEEMQLENLNYIFCDDNYLHDMNMRYLQHDTLTDVITFDFSDIENILHGDIFISISRVRDNAQDLNIDFKYELQRVMAHGVLHLCGYGDKHEDEIILMREKENYYIEKAKNIVL